MKIADRFAALASFFVKVDVAETAKYIEFLDFYETIVRNTPTAAVKKFGRLNVSTRIGGENKTFGLILTATDFMWWKSNIENGARFVNGIDAVQRAIFSQLSELAESLDITKESRAELLDILKSDS